MTAYQPLRLDEMFRASKGKPIQIGEETVRMAYDFKIPEGDTSGIITVRGFKPEPVQGICLEVNGAELEVNGARNPGIVLWLDSAPREIGFSVLGDSPARLRVWNCWRGRFGERQAWIGSAGLVCDQGCDGVYRFRCSDGPGSAEFDAIEFDVEFPA